MKRITNILRTSAIATAAVLLVSNADAQRRGGGGFGQMQSHGSTGNSGSVSRPQRQFSPSQSPGTITQSPRPQRADQFPSGGTRPVTGNSFPRQNSTANFPRHNTATQALPQVRQTPAPQSNFTPAPSRPNNNFRPQPSPSTARNYGNRNGYSNYGYRGGYNRRPVVVNRFYYGGAYHPHPTYYRPFTPRFGLHINILPVGYYPFYWSSRRYFYNDGIFYQPYNGYYETIVPPLGVFVPVIPAGAYPIVINGGNYYEYQGTYYQRNATNYEVVGVNGLLKSDMAAESDDGDIISDASISGSSSAPLPLAELPSTFKTVTLNNIVYYVSPAGEYYTKNIDDSGKVTYQVTAIESKGN